MIVADNYSPMLVIGYALLEVIPSEFLGEGMTGVLDKVLSIAILIYFVNYLTKLSEETKKTYKEEREDIKKDKEDMLDRLTTIFNKTLEDNKKSHEEEKERIRETFINIIKNDSITHIRRGD